MARIANHEGFDLPKVDTMAEIGKSRDISRAYEAGSVIGEYLEELGINLDLAPDADVLTNPDNTVVLDRSFGSDPVLVTQMTKAYVKGLEEHHVYGTPNTFRATGPRKETAIRVLPIPIRHGMNWNRRSWFPLPA